MIGLAALLFACGPVTERARGDGADGGTLDGGSEGDAAAPDAALCQPTYGGHEICDGLDNDCNDEVDDGCRPAGLAQLEPVACPGTFNGHRIAVSNSGAVFMVEFPGNESTPGTLHAVSRGGAVQLAINTALPFGASKIHRRGNDRLLVLGNEIDANNVLKLWIDELTPEGATAGTVFRQAIGFRGAGLGVHPDGRIFTADDCCDEPIVEVQADTVAEFAPGFGNNTSLMFSADGSRLFVASGIVLGETKPGGTFEEIHRFEGSVTGLDRDGAGALFAGIIVGDFNGIGRVYRLGPGDETPELILDVPAPIRGPAYDPINDELYVHLVAPTEDIAGCQDVNGTLYRWPLGTAP